MTDIGKGDLVECIDTAADREPRTPLVRGAIYTVASVNDFGAVTLEEVAPPPEYGGFALRLFRRLGPKRGAFDHLLSAKPDDAPGDAKTPRKMEPAQ